MSLTDMFKKNPKLFMIKVLGRVMPCTVACDKSYLKLLYKNRLKRTLDFNKVQTFNEKIQWLKIYDRCSEYTMMVDKYNVKKYVASIIGDQYIIPTLGIWKHFDDIDFEKLPNRFVLKCTHDSGGLVICKDKAKFDKVAAKAKIEHCLKRNYYLNSREWPYKNVKPCIIAEKYMVDESGYELKDYKLMCFNGKVRCSFTCSNRNGENGLYVNFYDKNWTPMPFERHYPRNPVEIEKPQCYDEMVRLAEKLAENIPFIRVDFYQIDKRPYFGELTFYPGSGVEEFEPEEWDYTLGNWLNLPHHT